jgi:iron complex outermembrane receptor protein
VVASCLNKWKGVGEQQQSQINFSFVQPVGRGEITGFLNRSERRENDYQDMSLEQIARLGRDFDNISGNYALAVRIADIGNNRGDTGAPISNAAAGTVYPAPIATVDDAYFDASGLRDDTLGALTFS